MIAEGYHFSWQTKDGQRICCCAIQLAQALLLPSTLLRCEWRGLRAALDIEIFDEYLIVGCFLEICDFIAILIPVHPVPIQLDDWMKGQFAASRKSKVQHPSMIFLQHVSSMAFDGWNRSVAELVVGSCPIALDVRSYCTCGPQGVLKGRSVAELGRLLNKT